ncbi:MAG TPA: hypothetical protein VMV49_14915, partial [Candidatus Deferrimicrobium sp.]|nr:hypothetical protein [Candidatus Deferrimicrobium sp.]
NATWAYAININKVFAFNNNTVTVYIKNSGRYPVTINDIFLNSSSTDFSILSGSTSPSPGSVSIFKLTSIQPLLFGNTLNIGATANYTLTLENVSSSYHVPFILDATPNISIKAGWPYSIAFDNKTSSNNDTVYLTVMNTGNMTVTLTNFLLYNGTMFIPHQFNSTSNYILHNQSIITLEPYQIMTYVNKSLAFDISAESAGFLAINVTADVVLNPSYHLSVLGYLRILHDQPNITIINDNTTTIAYHYTVPFPITVVTINLTNFGNVVLTMNLPTDIKLNGTSNYFAGAITLKPGESIIINTNIQMSPPTVGQFIKITSTAHYGTNTYTDEIIIKVYKPN